MRAKLSDAEFVERARASARRRSERQRLRKLESGKIQVNHWLTVPAKERLDALATELNASPSEVVTAAILAYLATPRPADQVVSQTAPESLPLFELPLTCINADLNSLVEGGSVKVEPADKPADKAKPDYSERDRLIVQFRGEGLGYEAIGKRLADVGILASTGNPVGKTTVKKVLKEKGLIEKEPQS